MELYNLYDGRKLHQLQALLDQSRIAPKPERIFLLTDCNKVSEWLSTPPAFVIDIP
jgi:hypothetical protein